MKKYFKPIIAASVFAAAVISLSIITAEPDHIKALSDASDTKNNISVKMDLYEQIQADMFMNASINTAINEKLNVEFAPQRAYVQLNIPNLYVQDEMIAYYEEDNSLIIPSDNITSGFGYQSWRHGNHKGIDIGRPQGDLIYSAAAGTVTKVVTGCPHNYGKSSSCGCGGGYGNYLVIDHGDGLETLYGHCQEIYVSVGDKVKRNEAIAEVGSTGHSTGWHLHFEVHDNGVAMNPFDYQ